MSQEFKWRLVKWLGLLLELYFLFVFVNGALLVPFPYDWKRVLFVAVSALIAGVCAFCSSLGTVKLSEKRAGTPLNVVFAAPFLLWGLVTASACVILGVHGLLA
jgi:hypothetical protein